MMTSYKTIENFFLYKIVLEFDNNRSELAVYFVYIGASDECVV